MNSTRFTTLQLFAWFVCSQLFLGDPGFGQPLVKQGPPVPVSFCISAMEMELYGMINEYRVKYNLPPVPLSRSLSYVAHLHARDLFLHHPDQGSCNFHSWSNRGTWTPFCYPRDETKKSSVWDKPRELTRYPAKGYEIVYWENNPLIRDTIIMVWKTEEYFNNFLLNQGKWQGKTWNAIGIAVYENYACAWFGEVPDPEGEAFVCGNTPKKQAMDTIKPAPLPVVKPVSKPKKARPPVNAIIKADSLSGTRPGLRPGKPPDSVAGIKVSSGIQRDSVTGIYYIIVMTSLPLDASEKLASTLRAGGYPGAKVLENDGKIRVSVFETTDKALVMAKLREVKKIYKDAWLLKK